MGHLKYSGSRTWAPAHPPRPPAASARDVHHRSLALLGCSSLMATHGELCAADEAEANPLHRSYEVGRHAGALRINMRRKRIVFGGGGGTLTKRACALVHDGWRGDSKRKHAGGRGYLEDAHFQLGVDVGGQRRRLRPQRLGDGYQPAPPPPSTSTAPRAVAASQIAGPGHLQRCACGGLRDLGFKGLGARSACDATPSSLRALGGQRGISALRAPDTMKLCPIQ